MDEIGNYKLPYDIIENILLRLPVKSLLSSKAVSKQWEATISDPEFAEVRLQQSKNSSSSRNLLAWQADDFGGCRVVKLENNKFQELSAIEYPREAELERGILCYCDGLYLKRCGKLKDKMYVLWNLSTRMYKKFHHPYPIDDCHYAKRFYGICYDRLMKDYKVVIGDMQHYAVFCCGNNEWTEMKELKDQFSHDEQVIDCRGVCFNGSIYWFVFPAREGMDFEDFEIVCFDRKDEKFKMLPMSDHKRETDCKGYSGLPPMMLYMSRDNMTIVKKVGDDNSWMEFKVHLPNSCHFAAPLCFMHEDEIILGDDDHYKLFNHSKNSLADIQRDSTTMWYSLPVPYQENVFCFKRS